MRLGFLDAVQLLDVGEKFGVQATVHGAIDGNNVPKALLIGLGVYLRW